MPGVRRVTENDKKMMARLNADTPPVANDDEGKKEGFSQESVPSVSPGSVHDAPPVAEPSPVLPDDSRPARPVRSGRRGRRNSIPDNPDGAYIHIRVPESLHKLIKIAISVLYLKEGKKLTIGEILHDSFLLWLRKNGRDVYDDFVKNGYVKD